MIFYQKKNNNNFDGSCLQSSCRRGIGGVIRDWNGNVIRSFFGPLHSLNANEAEVYALLIGYHELLRLGGYNVIIEGDSFWGYSMGFKETYCFLEVGRLGGGGVGYLKIIGCLIPSYFMRQMQRRMVLQRLLFVLLFFFLCLVNLQ